LSGSEDIERTLRVLDLPEEAGDDDIYAVFESKRIDGGPVESISRLADTSILVTFEDKAGKS